LADNVDLPTPPLPLATAINLGTMPFRRLQQSQRHTRRGNLATAALMLSANASRPALIKPCDIDHHRNRAVLFPDSTGAALRNPGNRSFDLVDINHAKGE
jgi:hypothetical protein